MTLAKGEDYRGNRLKKQKSQMRPFYKKSKVLKPQVCLVSHAQAWATMVARSA